MKKKFFFKKNTISLFKEIKVENKVLETRFLPKSLNLPASRARHYSLISIRFILELLTNIVPFNFLFPADGVDYGSDIFHHSIGLYE